MQQLWHGPLSIEGLCGTIWGFVVDYGMTGDLLEGKIGILSKSSRGE